ncbi:hypothetical protein RP20_CCG028202 [Aedes albopictus]|nr:hypothetical protein RP20_CCG028202 [Aedes albopictus]
MRDCELISCRLRRVEPLCRLPGSALQQLAMCGFYEDLEKGVTLFRAGEQGRYWYAVLGGQLEVRYHGAETKDSKVSGECAVWGNFFIATYLVTEGLCFRSSQVGCLLLS